MALSDDKILGMLPNPFIFNDGRLVKTAGDWRERRKEILHDAVGLEFGGMPPEPELLRVEGCCVRGENDLSTYLIFTGTKEKSFSFSLRVYRPAGSGKHPVLLTGDGCYRCCDDAVIGEANRRGYVVIIFNRTEIAPDLYNSKREQAIYLSYPNSEFSAISAWAWGYSRVMDAIEGFDFCDAADVTITGHSRGGKTVLLAGATDERFAYVNPNNSGAHGCGCYRYEQYEPESDGDKRSEKLEDLVRAVPYWMGPNMKDYIGRETELPHDMHFIKALVAPRCLLETNGLADIWGNPRGSYQTYLAARRVYELLGAQDNIAAWYRDGGHQHGLRDFTALMDFVDAKRAGAKAGDEYYRVQFPEMKRIFDF